MLKTTGSRREKENINNKKKQLQLKIERKIKNICYYKIRFCSQSSMEQRSAETSELVSLIGTEIV